MKKILLILCIAIFALGLTACGEAKEPAAEPNGQPVQENTQEDTQTVEGVPLEQYLAENYPLESEKIEIFASGEKEPVAHLATITDPADIQTLIDSVDFASWEAVKDPADGYAGICHYYIHFNDDCVIALYEEESYGYIGKHQLKDEYENVYSMMYEGLDDFKGDFFMAEGFLPTVQKMVEKYASPSA